MNFAFSTHQIDRYEGSKIKESLQRPIKVSSSVFLPNLAIEQYLPTRFQTL
jgi:hypothetical protein